MVSVLFVAGRLNMLDGPRWAVAALALYVIEAFNPYWGVFQPEWKPAPQGLYDPDFDLLGAETAGIPPKPVDPSWGRAVIGFGVAALCVANRIGLSRQSFQTVNANGMPKPVLKAARVVFQGAIKHVTLLALPSHSRSVIFEALSLEGVPGSRGHLAKYLLPIDIGIRPVHWGKMEGEG